MLTSSFIPSISISLSLASAASLFALGDTYRVDTWKLLRYTPPILWVIWRIFIWVTPPPLWEDYGFSDMFVVVMGISFLFYPDYFHRFLQAIYVIFLFLPTRNPPSIENLILVTGFYGCFCLVVAAYKIPLHPLMIVWILYTNHSPLRAILAVMMCILYVMKLERRTVAMPSVTTNVDVERGFELQD